VHPHFSLLYNFSKKYANFQMAFLEIRLHFFVCIVKFSG